MDSVFVKKHLTTPIAVNYYYPPNDKFLVQVIYLFGIRIIYRAVYIG